MSNKNPWAYLGLITARESTSNLADFILQQVIQNLQRLLNTRQRFLMSKEPLSVAQSSLLSYGIMDLTQLNPESADHQQSLCQALQSCIARHEPRLQQIQVELVNPVDSLQMELNFRVSGLLQLPEITQVIQLQTVLNLQQLAFAIYEEEAA